MTSTKRQAALGSAPPMPRVEWAIARYNYYRAFGLLGDSPHRTAESGAQHCPPDPLPPKPILKWYSLSRPDDDVAETYQPTITTRHRYSQRVEGAHPQTISTASHAANGLSYDPRAWSRVDWAVARYKWYRACGLLDDSPHRPAEITRYHRSPDPPRAKPHLKWYPLSEPDDEVARPYQRSGPVTPSAPSRKRHDQRVENAHVRTILARYQAEKEEAAKGSTSDNRFDPSKHPRDRIGQFTVKGESVTTSIGETSPASNQAGPTQREALAPKTVAFQTSDGKPFYVSTDDKWRHKPSAGLHVPGLATEDVETFLDLVEQASALSDAMSENYRQLREVRNEVQSRGWSLWPSPDHLRSLKTRQAQYERDRAALQFKWDELEAEYQKAGFRDLQVTGFRVGTNSEYQQDWDRGKGLTNVVQAYRKSQEEDLRGGRGLEATGDEMAIITAPADLVGAFRLGSALIRTGYHVVKQGAGYTLRKQVARISRAEADDFGKWAKDASAKAIAREHAEELLDAAQRNEPAITKAMERAAASGDAVLERIGSCLKTEESLTRKIADRAMERNPGPLSIDGINSAVVDAASRPSNTNDALRYTVCSKSTKDYYRTYDAIRRSLKDQGYEEIRTSNFWKHAGTSREIGYRGINSTFRSPAGQICEVQVHTPESLRMTERLHHLYEEARAVGTSIERKEVLDSLMKREWNNVPIPR